MIDCIFCKIVRGDIPTQKVYEDDDILAFHDIHPKARIHILIVPKKHIPTAMDVTQGDEVLMGKLIRAAYEVAQKSGLLGYRLQVNVGEQGGQEIFHLHFHLLGD